MFELPIITEKIKGKEVPFAYSFKVASKIQNKYTEKDENGKVTVSGWKKWLDLLFPEEGQRDDNALIFGVHTFVNEAIEVLNKSEEKKRKYITESDAIFIVTYLKEIRCIEIMTKLINESMPDNDEDDEEDEKN